jgi:hypothetical protein
MPQSTPRAVAIFSTPILLNSITPSSYGMTVDVSHTLTEARDLSISTLRTTNTEIDRSHDVQYRAAAAIWFRSRSANHQWLGLSGLKCGDPVRQFDMMMPCPVASVIAASSLLGRALGEVVKAPQQPSVMTVKVPSHCSFQRESLAMPRISCNQHRPMRAAQSATGGYHAYCFSHFQPPYLSAMRRYRQVSPWNAWAIPPILYAARYERQRESPGA